MKIKTAILIGSGNVATHISKALVKAGIKVVQVYSPTAAHAQALAKKLKATHTTKPAELLQNADIAIIAVKDDALTLVAKQLKMPKTLVVHTSGTADAAALKNCSPNYGVLYPFQTFTKGAKVKMAQVPLCIEGNNKTTKQQLKKLAAALSTQVYEISSAQRPWLHIMGVYASNFTNLMYNVAYQIATGHQIPFEIVYPLISQTADKAKRMPPARAQTGPAARGDAQVVEKHLKMLAYRPVFKLIYELNSHAINPLLKNNKMLIKSRSKLKK